MQLKTITTYEDGITEQKYSPLKGTFKIVFPNKQGNFGNRGYGYNKEEAPVNTVAIVLEASRDPIFIHKDQEAFLINEDGKTQTVINKVAPKVSWFRNRSGGFWQKTEDSFKGLKGDITSDSTYEFIEVPAGENPNLTREIPKEDNTVFQYWRFDLDQLVWIRISYEEYEKYTTHPNFKDWPYTSVPVGIDLNNPSSKDVTYALWMINHKGSSLTWRPCTQADFELNCNNPSYGFKKLLPGVDPNNIKQEWLK